MSEALETGAGLPWAASLTAFGALVAITSVLLVILYGQTRIFFAMARDGLVPESWADKPADGNAGQADHRVRHLRGPSRRVGTARGDRRDGQHRDAVCVCPPQRWGHDPAPDQARHAAAVQGASSLHLVPDRHPPLHLPDLGPAVGDLGPVRRMACRRDRDLPAVRVLALPAAAPLPRRPRPARHRARRPSDPRNTNPEAR